MFSNKNIKSILVFFYIMFFASLTSIVFAQGAGEPGGDIDLTTYFVSVPAIAAFALIVTQFIKNSFDITGAFSQYLAWIVSFILCGIGYWLQLGIMTGLEWYYIFIYGLASGLIANGLYDWNWIKAILQLLKLLPEKKPGY